jgi:ubiquinone/menaquinone biosynthesis C-methylase UbiE
VAVNAQYNVAQPNSMPIKIAAYQRRKMFASFLEIMRVGPTDTILDVGATSDQSYAHSNYLEAWYPHKTHVIAVGLDDAAMIESLYSGVRFIRANGLHLPFKDDCFDYVHSSAVLEHVGQHSKQAQFLREIWCVARKGVFVTTPNRGFPVEFHTVLPLLHWLPMSLYRRILVVLGKRFFATEDNLNLLSRRSLVQLAHAAGIKPFRVSGVSLLGWPTNLLLIGHKDRPLVAGIGRDGTQWFRLPC